MTDSGAELKRARRTATRFSMVDGSLWVVAVFAVAVALGGWLRPARTGASERVADAASLAIVSAEWDSIAQGGGRTGADSAPVVVEFSDYECPFCRASEGVLAPARQQGSVRIAYFHLPLNIHPAARGAALAAICAEAQGRFAQMHDLLMNTDSWRSDRDWVALGARSGVRSRDEFASCLRSAAASNRLERDMSLARRLGVRATPTYFTQRLRSQGAMTRETLKQMVEAK